MEAKMFFMLCSVLAAAVEAKQLMVKLEDDRPSLRIPVSHTATLECCYSCSTDLTVNWSQTVMITHNETHDKPVGSSERVTFGLKKVKNGVTCHSLELRNASVDDMGLYWCLLNHTSMRTTLQTHGTFLQVFEPLQKTLQISERTKNSIITAEGVLLLLCLLVPGTMLICKTKGLQELERRKGKEEENIYEGLNLDDCTSTYHQIQRSQVQGPYHDVLNTVEEDIQLEKP